MNDNEEVIDIEVGPYESEEARPAEYKHRKHKKHRRHSASHRHSEQQQHRHSEQQPHRSHRHSHHRRASESAVAEDRHRDHHRHHHEHHRRSSDAEASARHGRSISPHRSREPDHRHRESEQAGFKTPDRSISPRKSREPHRHSHHHHRTSSAGGSSMPSRSISPRRSVSPARSKEPEGYKFSGVETSVSSFPAASVRANSEAALKAALATVAANRAARGEAPATAALNRASRKQEQEEGTLMEMAAEMHEEAPPPVQAPVTGMMVTSSPDEAPVTAMMDLASKEKEEKPLASVREVFSFGSGPRKHVCLVVGLFCAFASGCVFPILTFLFAKSFEDIGAAAAADDFMYEVKRLAYWFMALGGGAFVFMSGQATMMETVAGEMTHSLKTQWFTALLRQDMAYYDIKDISGTATIISTNGAKYKKGLGRKLGEAVQFSVTFLGALAYAFWASWRTSLIILATVPFMTLSMLFLLKMTMSQSEHASKSYAEAGSIVQTTVAAIRTVLSLNAVRRVIDKFVVATQKAYDEAVKRLYLVGLANGLMMATMLLAYIVIALYGAFLLYDNIRGTGCDPSGVVPGVGSCDPKASEVFGALMGITFGAAVLPQVSVGIEAFNDARAAAYPAVQVINRKVGDEDSSEESKGQSSGGQIRRSSTARLPKYVIDSSSEDGLMLPSLKGNIEFDNITFAYPTRQEKTIFDGFSMNVEAGKTIAIVGPSGCGKSTTVQLLERFYDPTGGAVKLDGVDLRDINVHWLRQQVGLVSQEPALFACSIRENIAYGSPNATQEQIEEAARMANAHSFIEEFSDKYDTNVGDQGAQLSGGQKQRIAIARVLVKNPRILLLDEATSALDSESESVVQEALDRLLEEGHRTTIVIAHRLSTVKNADLIYVSNNGKIEEVGTHSQLIAQQGQYYKLVQAQKTQPTDTPPSSGPSSRNASYVDIPALDVERGMPLLRFRNVHFCYPSRPHIEIFRGLDLDVYEGETLALVGPSGHGKSTTVQLIERFYDCDAGSVELDGVDITELNVEYLRGQLGLVSQEPVLFDTTIAENIRFSMPNATQEMMEDAAKLANAHNFIVSFPDGYETQVGEGGAQISGGQKQRIAIARALLRRPRILLLDEATSALDSESERVVQEALDNIMASETQTTIVIAHRLATIRNANRIAVVESGKVREIGTHDELMAKPNGHYRRLQAFQNLEDGEIIRAKKKKLDDDEGDEDKVEKDKKKEEEESEVDKEIEKRNAKRARSLSRPDRKYFVIGSAGAVLFGLLFPAWGIIFAFVIEMLYVPVFPCDEEIDPSSCPVYYVCVPDCQDYYDSVADNMKAMAWKIAVGCVGLMVTSTFGSMLVFYGFGTASERMNKRVRDAAFNSLVRQEVGFFDLRTVGTITSQLQDDAALIHSFSGEPIRSLVINISSVLVGVVVSFVFMWPFALLALATIPFMGFGAEMEMKMYMGEDEGVVSDETDHNSPGHIVVESLVNIRTVASLTIEERRASEYSDSLRAEDPTPIRTNFIKGMATGLGQFIQMWGIAFMFWWGAWLLNKHPRLFTFRDFLISMMSLLFSLSGMGAAAQGATDRKKAKLAANRIFELMDRPSAIDPIGEGGEKGISAF